MSRTPNTKSACVIECIEADLKLLVQEIAYEVKWLLEVVNHNVHGRQYVCAREVQALDCLTEIMNYTASDYLQLEVSRWWISFAA